MCTCAVQCKAEVNGTLTDCFVCCSLCVCLFCLFWVFWGVCCCFCFVLFCFCYFWGGFFSFFFPPPPPKKNLVYLCQICLATYRPTALRGEGGGGGVEPGGGGLISLPHTDIERDGHEISRFGGLPRELYFPKGLHFPPKWAALRENFIPRENKTILAPPTHDISSVPVNICYILDGQN